MDGKFYSRKRNRLNGYNYSNKGYYYVTICTKDRECVFGDIENDEMALNEYGDIARNSWLDLPNHHKGIELDQFIVMPNHIHGIVTINCIAGNGPARSSNKDAKNNNLSVIVGSYKSTITKQINRLEKITFKWQKSFHDHIVRIDRVLYKIRDYIVTNPKTWDTDENNIKNFL